MNVHVLTLYFRVCRLLTGTGEGNEGVGNGHISTYGAHGHAVEVSSIISTVEGMLSSPNASETTSCVLVAGCKQRTEVCIHNQQHHVDMYGRSQATPAIISHIARFFFDTLVHTQHD